MTHRLFRPAVALLCVLTVTGCAAYHARTLTERPNLASGLAALDRTLPSQPGIPEQTLPADRPLAIDQIGIIAILNDPGLAVERGKLANAQANLLTASILPNPQISLGFSALLGGPGATTPSYAASLSQDIMSLVTYRARMEASRETFASVNASLLWQEWEVAQKARLLALQIHGDNVAIRYRRHESSLLTAELGAVRQATAAGNLDLSAEAPLTAAVATAQSSLAIAMLSRLKAWQELDALLGLEPFVRFPIARPRVTPPPSDLAELIATLPQRRPDLVALQFGYSASEARLREAILLQFPSLMLGPSYGQDTSDVKSIGPTATLDLPIFNRNQGGVARAKATREELYANYQARLDDAIGTARALDARIKVLRTNYREASRQAADAGQIARHAEQAYGQGSIDQRALADYQTTVLQRQLDATDFKTRMQADELALGIELGIGLPATRLTIHPTPPAHHHAS